VGIADGFLWTYYEYVPLSKSPVKVGIADLSLWTYYECVPLSKSPVKVGKDVTSVTSQTSACCVKCRIVECDKVLPPGFRVETSCILLCKFLVAKFGGFGHEADFPWQLQGEDTGPSVQHNHVARQQYTWYGRYQS
jgi:hypothetical protein